MIALIQRVDEAGVVVDGERIASIARGVLALVAVEPGDAEPDDERMLERLLGYRVFEDESGRMNRSLRDIGGGLLLVPSSRSRPIRARACAPASPAPRRRSSAGACSI